MEKAPLCLGGVRRRDGQRKSVCFVFVGVDRGPQEHHPWPEVAGMAELQQ